jgi:3D (Asp-Asp-Asp) domain-containing protein
MDPADMFIARSMRRKVLVTAVAALAFVWVYETTILDSKDARIPSLLPTDMTPPEPGAQLNFTATAYCKGLIAAAGVAAQAGVAAGDPALLPLGSVVEIDSPDSRYDGIYTILDTGPAIQGRVIDIYMWSCHEALKFGRRPIRVTVLRLGWNPRATAPGFMDRLFRPRVAAREREPLPSRPLPLEPASN